MLVTLAVRGAGKKVGARGRMEGVPGGGKGFCGVRAGEWEFC